MKRYLIIVCWLLFAHCSCAQFWNDMHNIYFRLEDSAGNVITNAEIMLNGVRMSFYTDCNLFADKKCYRAEQKKDSVKFLSRNKVIIKAPGYLDFNDSVTYGAAIVLRKAGDNYYFNQTRMPCRIKEGWFFASFENESTRDEMKELVEKNKGKILKEYSYCGFLDEDIGPFILVFKLKGDTVRETELLQKIYLRGEVGPLVEGPKIPGMNGWAGLMNTFSITYRPSQRIKAEQLLEELKQKGRLKDYDFERQSNTIIIHAEKWNEKSILPLIENLLETGLFFDPVMGLMIYNCPG